MKVQFVVAVDNPSNEDSGKISNLFRDKYGWWHWINGIWLVCDSSGSLTAAKIRDDIHVALPTARTLVIQVSPIFWTGYGPNDPKNSMFEWIRKNWE